MLGFSRAALAAALTFAVLSGPALAASTCATDTDMAAFRTAAVQQQLMVAALTCHDVEAYNRFVLAYQPELQKSDADLKAYFTRRGNVAAYDTFKTKLANLSSLSDIANGPAYCSNAAAAFDMALKSRQALSSFVADQRLMIAMPKQTVCSEAKPQEPVLEEAAAQQPPIAAPTKAVAVKALPAPAVRLASIVPTPRPAPLAETKPVEKVRVAVAPQAVAQSAHDAPATYTYKEPTKEIASAPPPPGTHTYKEEDEAPPPPEAYSYREEASAAPVRSAPQSSYDEEEDLPLPPRPQTAAARRAQAYYAQQYAASWSRNRWTPRYEEDDDYYRGR